MTALKKGQKYIGWVLFLVDNFLSEVVVLECYWIEKN